MQRALYGILPVAQATYWVTRVMSIFWSVKFVRALHVLSSTVGGRCHKSRIAAATWCRPSCPVHVRTGLEFGKSQRAVENREKWRKLVAIICGAQTTLAVKGLMMMMMMMMSLQCARLSLTVSATTWALQLQTGVTTKKHVCSCKAHFAAETCILQRKLHFCRWKKGTFKRHTFASATDSRMRLGMSMCISVVTE